MFSVLIMVIHSRQNHYASFMIINEFSSKKQRQQNIQNLLFFLFNADLQHTNFCKLNFLYVKYFFKNLILKSLSGLKILQNRSRNATGLFYTYTRTPTVFFSCVHKVLFSVLLIIMFKIVTDFLALHG